MPTENGRAASTFAQVRSCCRKPQRSKVFCHLAGRHPCCSSVYFQLSQLFPVGAGVLGALNPLRHGGRLVGSGFTWRGGHHARTRNHEAAVYRHRRAGRGSPRRAAPASVLPRAGYGRDRQDDARLTLPHRRRSQRREVPPHHPRYARSPNPSRRRDLRVRPDRHPDHRPDPGPGLLRQGEDLRHFLPG